MRADTDESADGQQTAAAWQRSGATIETDAAKKHGQDRARPASSVPGPPLARFVGRESELALIEHALDLTGSSPRTIAITGEPGIGKTALIVQSLAIARERGHLAVVGRGDELERILPLGIFADALDAHLASLDRRSLDRLYSDDLVNLAAVFPSLSTLAGEHQQARGVRRRAFSVRTLLSHLAVERPTVIALDGLHWADEASLGLVAELIRHPEKRVLLVLGFRSTQPLRRITNALEDAARDGTAVHVDLPPLTGEEADELAGEEIEPGTRRSLYRQSGGNPFYLAELAQAAREGRHEQSVPHTLAAAIDRETCALSERVSSVLHAAAVAGDPFEPDVVAAAANVDEESVLAALDELLALDIVRPADHYRRFRFRHPIVARAIYEAVPRGWRIAAHARTERFLSRRGASPAARAPHVRLSARVGDRDAITLLREAGHTSATRDPERAAEWFRAALELLPGEQEDASERAELLTSIATALRSAGRLTECKQALRQALDVSHGESAEALTTQHGPGASLEALTDRQLEVAELITQGKRNREIAAELSVRVVTVEKHISRIFQRLGVSSRAAVAAALVARRESRS